MRSYQIFQTLTPSMANQVLKTLAERSPAIFSQAVAVASAAMKARPAYLMRQPVEKRVVAVRRGLSRIAANEIAEQVLAVYFTECRNDLLVEWLDMIGVEHDAGTLTEDAPSQPKPGVMRAAVERFQTGEGAEERVLLLHAFAAQSSIDWPDLDALLGASTA